MATNKKKIICGACLEVSKLAVWQRQAAMLDSFRSTGLFPSHGLVFSPPEASATPECRQPAHESHTHKTTADPQCSPLTKLRSAWRKRSSVRKDTLRSR